MNYYFVSASDGSTHVIVAESPENARGIATQSGIEVINLYELLDKTFNEEGFLVSTPAFGLCVHACKD